MDQPDAIGERSDHACVVVSYWTGHKAKVLHRLLDQMLRIDAGAAFALVVACNGGDREPLVLPARFAALQPTVVNRANRGYNIGAWDAGWRARRGHTHYLFVQDECFIKAPGWLSEFAFRMQRDPGLGLLGESLMWDRMSWEYIREATDRDLGSGWYEGSVHPLDFYQRFLDQRGIPRGATGTHLQSLVLFSSGHVLEEIDGFPVGDSYQEAVACEVGVSRLVEARGYRVSKVKDSPFALIGHPQWTYLHALKREARRAVAQTLKGVWPPLLPPRSPATGPLPQLLPRALRTRSLARPEDAAQA